MKDLINCFRKADEAAKNWKNKIFTSYYKF